MYPDNPSGHFGTYLYVESATHVIISKQQKHNVGHVQPTSSHPGRQRGRLPRPTTHNRRCENARMLRQRCCYALLAGTSSPQRIACCDLHQSETAHEALAAKHRTCWQHRCIRKTHLRRKRAIVRRAIVKRVAAFRTALPCAVGHCALSNMLSFAAPLSPPRCQSQSWFCFDGSHRS